MKNTIIKIDAFKIIGIAIETTNADGQAMGNLWGQFFAQQISTKVPNKMGAEIYAIYTDYETDHTGKYTAILGHKVHSLKDIPKGLVGREFSTSEYQHFQAKGSMPAAIGIAWRDIWLKDKILNRKYIADFEIYGEQSQNGDKSVVDIYVSVQCP